MSGYLATHVVAKALEAGYAVRGTVRSAAKRKDIQARYAHIGDRFDIAVVEDIVTGDLTAALQGITAVIHIASPFTGKIQDPKKDMLDPAIKGTLNVVQATHKAGIERMVITSSMVAVLNFGLGGAFRDYTYTANDWNPATYEEAVKGDKPGMWIYSASKTLAEKAAFEYAEQHPELKITTINPPFIFGPPEHLVGSTTSLNTSTDTIYQLLNGKLPPDGLPLFSDVRDVAKAHVLALQHDSVIGKRVLLSGGPFTMYDTVKIIAEKRPELKSRLPSLENVVPETRPISKVDTTIAEKSLGLPAISFEKCIFDTIDALLEKEDQKWHND